jgi:hypothetical protein
LCFRAVEIPELSFAGRVEHGFGCGHFGNQHRLAIEAGSDVVQEFNRCGEVANFRQLFCAATGVDRPKRGFVGRHEQTTDEHNALGSIEAASKDNGLVTVQPHDCAIPRLLAIDQGHEELIIETAADTFGVGSHGDRANGGRSLCKQSR